MTNQPAGEHHTGTLNLAGTGNPEPELSALDALWRNLVETEMRYRGYTDEQIEVAGRVPVHVDRCYFDHNNHAWVCSAPSGTSYHPDADEYGEIVGVIERALEAAYPAIRQQVAQEIATAIEDVANSLRESANTTRQRSIDTGGRTTAEGDQLMTIALNRNNRAGGFRDAAYLAREIGGAE